MLGGLAAGVEAHRYRTCATLTATFPMDLFQSGLFFIFQALSKAMTHDECQHRADEAKALAVQTQDLWERETYLRIATQWQLLAAHKAIKVAKPAS
jgi:hypothetical protein